MSAALDFLKKYWGICSTVVMACVLAYQNFYTKVEENVKKEVNIEERIFKDKDQRDYTVKTVEGLPTPAQSARKIVLDSIQVKQTIEKDSLLIHAIKKFDTITTLNATQIYLIKEDFKTVIDSFNVSNQKMQKMIENYNYQHP